MMRAEFGALNEMRSVAMVAIETNIEIEADIEHVWRVLTDFARMSEWNPFMRNVRGAPAFGAPLKFSAVMAHHPPMRIAARIGAFAPPRELRWRGSLFSPKLFEGEHYFLLEAPRARRTRLEHGERFSGALASVLMRGGTMRATEQGFCAMNEALKRRCENENASSGGAAF